MINLCTFPSLTTKQLLDIISTDLIRLLCYCFLGFYWLLGDKSVALRLFYGYTLPFALISTQLSYKCDDTLLLTPVCPQPDCTGVRAMPL